MARSLLGSFVSGTRQVLFAQLFISAGAVGLAGWTLAVTNDLIRERERLRERVIQLEQTIAEGGGIVPGPTTTVEQTAPAPADQVYPGQISEQAEVVSPETSAANESAAAEEVREEAPPEAEPQPQSPPAAAPTPSQSADAVLGRIITDLFTPPPAVSTVVLHARNEDDAAYARRLATALTQSANVRYVIEVMAPRDPRQSGYAYYDGRQSRAAAAIVQQFHDAARRQEIGAWSAQLRGVALPAQGQYTAERIDIVLPPLPAASPSRDAVIDPRVVRGSAAATREVETARPPPIR